MKICEYHKDGLCLAKSNPLCYDFEIKECNIDINSLSYDVKYVLNWGGYHPQISNIRCDCNEFTPIEGLEKIIKEMVPKEPEWLTKSLRK